MTGTLTTTAGIQKPFEFRISAKIGQFLSTRRIGPQESEVIMTGLAGPLKR
jgi:hypothetical protein